MDNKQYKRQLEMMRRQRAEITKELKSLNPLYRKKVYKSYQDIIDAVCGLTPKEKVKLMVDFGNYYSVYDLRDSTAFNLRQVILDTTEKEEMEELKNYLLVLQALIDAESTIAETRDGLILHQLNIEYTIDRIIRVCYIVYQYNKKMENVPMSHVINLRKELRDGLSEYLKEKEISLTFKGKTVSVDTTILDERVNLFVTDYQLRLEDVKIAYESYKAFVKMNGVEDWMPDKYRYTFDLAMTDHNKGRKFCNGIIRDIILNTDWEEELGVLGLESEVLLGSKYTKDLPPLYPTFKERTYKYRKGDFNFFVSKLQDVRERNKNR